MEWSTPSGRQLGAVGGEESIERPEDVWHVVVMENVVEEEEATVAVLGIVVKMVEEAIVMEVKEVQIKGNVVGKEAHAKAAVSAVNRGVRKTF